MSSLFYLQQYTENRYYFYEGRQYKKKMFNFKKKIKRVLKDLSEDKKSNKIKDTERGENMMRWGGFFLLFAGIVTVSYGLFDWKQWPFISGGQFNTTLLLISQIPGVIIVFPVWCIYIYNTFVEYRLRTENAWRQIDVDLKMRFTLIPQLVSAVKGYMKHEQDLLESLTSLRTRGVSSSDSEIISMEKDMAGTMNRVMILIEKYPELEAQPLTKKLHREIFALEEKIAHGRTVYNEAVNEYNDNVMCFPKVILAKMFGFKSKGFFAIEE